MPRRSSKHRGHSFRGHGRSRRVPAAAWRHLRLPTGGSGSPECIEVPAHYLENSEVVLWLGQRCPALVATEGWRFLSNDRINAVLQNAQSGDGKELALLYRAYPDLVTHHAGLDRAFRALMRKNWFQRLLADSKPARHVEEKGIRLFRQVQVLRTLAGIRAKEAQLAVAERARLRRSPNKRRKGTTASDDKGDEWKLEQVKSAEKRERKYSVTLPVAVVSCLLKNHLTLYPAQVSEPSDSWKKRNGLFPIPTSEEINAAEIIFPAPLYVPALRTLADLPAAERLAFENLDPPAIAAALRLGENVERRPHRPRKRRRS